MLNMSVLGGRLDISRPLNELTVSGNSARFC